MRVVFHPEAHAEMIEQARYYEAKCEGLGSDFLNAIEETTQNIERFPETGRIDRKNSQATRFGFSFHDPLRSAA